MKIYYCSDDTWLLRWLGMDVENAGRFLDGWLLETDQNLLCSCGLDVIFVKNII